MLAGLLHRTSITNVGDDLEIHYSDFTLLLWLILRHSDCRENILSLFDRRPGQERKRAPCREVHSRPAPLSLRTQLLLMYSQPRRINYHYTPIQTPARSPPVLSWPTPAFAVLCLPFKIPLHASPWPLLPLVAYDCSSSSDREHFFDPPLSKRNVARVASPCLPSANPARPLSCAVKIPGRWAFSYHNTTFINRSQKLKLSL